MKEEAKREEGAGRAVFLGSLGTRWVGKVQDVAWSWTVSGGEFISGDAVAVWRGKPGA